MKIPNKYSALSIALGLILTTALISPVTIAQERTETVKVKHKVIQVNQENESPTTIEIEQDGNMQVIEISAEELADEALLNNKLSSLDKETRIIVMQVLSSKDKHFSSKGSGMHTRHKYEMTVDDVDIDIDSDHDVDIDIDSGHDVKHVKEILVINDGDNVDFKGPMKAHYQAIIKLIEKGKFTPDQLAEIQRALDAKY